MTSLSQTNRQKIHLAVIPDGNRRYGLENSGSKVKGYDEGVKALKCLLLWFAKEKDVSTLTLYAFSEDNWKRPDEEIDYIMNIFKSDLNDVINSFTTIQSQEASSSLPYLSNRFEEINNMIDDEKDDDEKGEEEDIEIFFKFCSTELNHPKIPKDVKETIEIVNKKFNDECDVDDKQKKVVNICFSYDGKKEIEQAFEKAQRNGGTIEDHLLIRSQPDIILRTSGEKRLSGFLPWQSVYSEFFFLDKKWPEIEKSDFEDVLKDYFKRQKRYGK